MKRDADGRLTRFEYRGKYLRASRTGGLSLRAQGKAAGLNFTMNSNHGMRVSTRIAKGTNVGLQNGRFVLRGRYGKGPTKLNLSKSGLSVSSKTSLGTINWFKPRYSSVKIAGIQLRGKNAVYIQVFLLIGQLFIKVVGLLGQLVTGCVQGSYRLGVGAYQRIQQLGVSHKQGKVRQAEDAWENLWRHQTLENILCALLYILLALSRGRSDFSQGLIQNALIGYTGSTRFTDMMHKVDKQTKQEVIVLVHQSLVESALSPVLLLESFFGTLVEIVRRQLNEQELLDLFLELDQAILGFGERTQLQEKLLCVFADTCGLDASG
jgi:hypothetical protein